MTSPNYFLILGLSESCDSKDIELAYAELNQFFQMSKFEDNARAKEQALSCISKIKEAYENLQSADFRKTLIKELAKKEDPYLPEKLKPLIGHLCVTARIITYDDLLEAIRKQTDIDLPLGQILQQRGLMSQTELEGLLMGQKLYGAPSKELDQTTRRLLAFEIVSLDMVKIALVEQRTSSLSLPELLVKRGFLEEKILSAIASKSN